MENIMLDEKKKNIKIVGKYYWLETVQTCACVVTLFICTFKEVHLAHIFLISVILGFVTEFLPSINFNLAGSNCISN